ncbi:helix-turn-helix domain-containing protein [Plantactinospora sp. GCM10030261]|uniref:helix-turn-helix domain-containing protein n=1 Tax=Plantactinospora sp. GCM10030261 TaxID=3273420 RepID=UPI0036185A42
MNDYRRALRKCPDVTGSNLTVGLLMAEFADYGTGMDCFPSQRTIASEMCFTSTRQVRACLRWLKEVGWLHDTGATVESDGPHRGSRIYWLTIPDCPHRHDGSALPVVKD